MTAGVRLSHMAFLVPCVTAFRGLLAAGGACLAHAIMMGNVRAAA